MQKTLYFALSIYFLFYVFESPIRYGLHLAGRDEWIFLRDVLLAVPLLMILIRQILDRHMHPAFVVFFGVIALHGLVMVMNTHSVLAVAYSAKLLMGMLAGAIASHYFFAPGQRMVLFFFLLWAVSAIGVGFDKYIFDFPWTGMQTSIGGMDVDISRDWQVLGEAKRAGGFMRSSINVAIFMPLLAFLLMFHTKNVFIRTSVALGTLLVLYWTTQKGALIAYACTGFLLAMPKPWRFPLLRAGFFAFTLAMIALPLILPGHAMPQSEFFASFNARVDEMWPEGWNWIARHEIFPFGIGLGGLGGAQRTWAADDYTAGDNMYIFLYANFGVMALAYLGWLVVSAMRVDGSLSPAKSQMMATLMFLMGYGCVLSLVEDQMALLFLGASAAWLTGLVQVQKGRHQAISKEMSYAPA